MERNLEDQLRQALKREPAPDDFSRNVMARIRARTVRTPWWKRRAALVIAAALFAGAVIPATLMETRRERGLKARNQLLDALSVTNAALRHTKRMMRRSAGRRA